MERCYLVRYGRMAEVGRFASRSEAGSTAPHARGSTVVVRTHRGLELGEVLLESNGPGVESRAGQDTEPRILREARPDDLDQARRVDRTSARLYDSCREILQGTGWSGEVLDVEVLIDGVVVAYCLGPVIPDHAGLHALLHNEHGLDLRIESVGRDPTEHSDPRVLPGCSSCHGSAGGCGGGGGSCATSGCGSCGIGDLLAARA